MNVRMTSSVELGVWVMKVKITTSSNAVTCVYAVSSNYLPHINGYMQLLAGLRKTLFDF
jgi:hypothetical protein